jgi:hypothetical protein
MYRCCSRFSWTLEIVNRSLPSATETRETVAGDDALVPVGTLTVGCIITGDYLSEGLDKPALVPSEAWSRSDLPLYRLGVYLLLS